MVLDASIAVTALKVMRMTSTVPVGDSTLALWNAEMAVEPVANDAGFVSGAALNSGVLPPLTRSMTTTSGS